MCFISSSEEREEIYAFISYIRSYLAYVCIRLTIFIGKSFSEIVGLCSSSAVVVLKTVTV
jgi:hypothetical protein